MSASLVLHRGGYEVPREELVRYVIPPATRTWGPISHEVVLDIAEQTLTEAGYRIAKMRLGVSHEGQRFFSTLDLATPLTPDGQVTLAVGLRNSTVCRSRWDFVPVPVYLSACVMIADLASLSQKGGHSGNCVLGHLAYP
ncbi:MAG TPA: hypothetical protein VHR66_11820 [Gemmataceae bacterium]|jgi:hypothetical protein|nr:hypothetical protein [Gemmataceae bacterium]